MLTGNTLLQTESRAGMKGCIRNIQAFDKPFTSTEKEVGVTGCFSSYSRGLFMGSGGGYGIVSEYQINSSYFIYRYFYFINYNLKGSCL